MTRKLRITVFIDESSMPELFAELEPLGGRARSDRIRNLSMAGLLLTRIHALQTSGEPERRLDESATKPSPGGSVKRKVVRKILQSMEDEG